MIASMQKAIYLIHSVPIGTCVTPQAKHNLASLIAYVKNEFAISFQ